MIVWISLHNSLNIKGIIPWVYSCMGQTISRDCLSHTADTSIYNVYTVIPTFDDFFESDHWFVETSNLLQQHGFPSGFCYQVINRCI